MRIKTVLAASLVVLCLAGSARPQDFTIRPNQIEISVAPSFNHVPLRIPLGSARPELDWGELEVSSDAGWVAPTVDAANAKIVFSFATANLAPGVYTATISASINGATETLFVRARVAPLNMVKLRDDPFRSRMYGLHQDDVNIGSVVILNPFTLELVGNITVGKKPADLAVSSDGRELLVINAADESISVIDLDALVVKESLSLPVYTNWGAGSTSANIALGPDDIIYYTDGAWAPVLRVLKRSTLEVLQAVQAEGGGEFGLGGIGLNSDKSLLFGWAQFGWSAGSAHSFVSKFAVDGEGLLTFLEKRDSPYPSLIFRDPRDTPVLISGDDRTVFIKQAALDPLPGLRVLHSFPGPVYSITPGGEIAATATAIYEAKSGVKLADLPHSAPVQAIAFDYSRLVYFDPAARTVRSLDLAELIRPDLLSRSPVPADGSFTLPPSQLQWFPRTGAFRYHVYLGDSEAAVSGAHPDSPVFAGETSLPSLALADSLTPGTRYFWRVDAVTESGIAKGDLLSFTVSVFSSGAEKINVTTLQGHSAYRVSFELDTEEPGASWEAGADRPWVSFVQSSGATPSLIEVLLDASALPPGLHEANISIGAGPAAMFSIPVILQVNPLNITVMKSDPETEFVYAINESGVGAAARAYLLEINSLTEAIERVVPVGESVTDLAIHNGDNRIYVPNWLGGKLLAIDKETFEHVQTYTFTAFAGAGSGGDVYRVTSGAPGRLVIEEADQWVRFFILDTVSGNRLADSFAREGGGAMAPGGRFYYRGDNNISNASLRKFDLAGDGIEELTAVRVTSVSYYGSKTVVVSEDGARVFWNGSVFDADLAEEWTIGDEIFSATPDGRFAFSETMIYDVPRKQAALGMPADSRVSAFNSSSAKLIVQTGDSLSYYQIAEPLSLPAPVLSARSVRHDAAILAWTDHSLETHFTLQRRDTASPEWVDLAAPARNVVEFTVGGLAPETSYEFRIKAESGAVSSEWSNVLAVTTPRPPPATPFLDAPVVTTSSVSLSWSQSAGAGEFVLERSVGGTADWLQLAVLPADTTSFMDVSVVSLNAYAYRVKAAHEAGESSYSNVQTVTVPAPAPPPAPAGLAARVLSRSSVLLTWNPASQADGYRLQRRTEDPDTWTEVAVLDANSTSHTVADLLEGVQYHFRVQAYNDIGDSPFSTPVSVTPVHIVRLIEDDFDPDWDTFVWIEVLGGVSVNGGAGFLGSNALWFGAAGPRQATTVPLDVSRGGAVEFRFRAGDQSLGHPFWAISAPNESVALEFSTDGSVWTQISIFNTAHPSMRTWTSFSTPVPSAAQGSQTRFRWRQLSHRGPGAGAWALEDVAVVAVNPAPPAAPPFIISSASSSTSVAILWMAANGATAFVLERRRGTQTWTEIARLASHITYFTDTDALPSTAYSYRVKAVSAAGESAYSPTTISVTWSQMEDWIAQNYGSKDAISKMALRTKTDNGTIPLLHYAFNLAVDEPGRTLIPSVSDSGFPAIWFDRSTERMFIEFVRRKASTNPDITYGVEVSTDLVTWTSGGIEVGREPIDSLWDRVRYEDALPPGEVQLRFYRLAVRPID